MNYLGLKEWALSYLDSNLPDNLHYHGKHHTLDVLQVVRELCAAEAVDAYHRQLIQTAALFHDIGFTESRHEHEATGCRMAADILPEYGYTPGEIEMVAGMIMATKIPQNPSNKYGEILCDADLDYLGRNDFDSIGETLYRELRSFGVLDDRLAWNRIQVGFIEKHSYFTKTNQQRREPQKQRHLSALRDWLARHSENKE